MEQDKVTKASDPGSNVWTEDETHSGNAKPEYVPSYGERWNKARPTKAIVFWISLAAVILTMIVGFNWGGWVTGGTAQVMANEAVVQRLATVCVGQYGQDLGKIEKLRELKEESSFRRDDYVIEQGWATMPGEENPNNKVADVCAKLLVEISQ